MSQFEALVLSNFRRTMKVLTDPDPYPRTPALAGGIADHIWTCEDIAALLDCILGP